MHDSKNNLPFFECGPSSVILLMSAHDPYLHRSMMVDGSIATVEIEENDDDIVNNKHTLKIH